MHAVQEGFQRQVADDILLGPAQAEFLGGGSAFQVDGYQQQRGVTPTTAVGVSRHVSMPSAR